MAIVRTGHSTKAADDILEILTGDAAPLDLIRHELEMAQSDASDYLQRNENARKWWHDLWNGQTVDGRKWARDTETVWPWPGASDTRPHTCDRIVGQFLTVQKAALNNMRLQARSTNPIISARQSQQMTMLLNWTVFTHMLTEWKLEKDLLVAWMNGYGAAGLAVEWEQQRRVDEIDINNIVLTAWLQYNGEDIDILGVADLLNDPSEGAEETLVKAVQSMSPLVTTKKARSIVSDLRTVRFSKIPVPYVFKSQPRITALRFMVDLIIPGNTGDIQRARWCDRVEWVTQTELTDRIVTDNYDADFVDKAIEHKGRTTNENWATRTMVERGSTGYAYHDFEERIELHHFYYKALYRGVPVLYCTVFHQDVVDAWAKHEPYGYAHGQYPFHAFRFETHDRGILTSRGIPEIAYTWQNEIKKQRDGRTDRVDISLKPPFLADYRDVEKIQSSFGPGVIWPERKSGTNRFMPPPEYDPGSIEIEQTVSHAINEHFGLFGEIDPALKALRQQEAADHVIDQMKPALQQIGQLLQQYMPDDEATRVVGPMQRPFKLSRADIQGAYELSATVDMREIDPDFLKQKFAFLGQILGWDTLGVIDRTEIVIRGLEAVDFTLADTAVRSPEAASNAEIEDEIDKVSKIVGSGIEQPLPKTGNFPLRLQTLMNTLRQTPGMQQTLQKNPGAMKALQNRALYFQRQTQQQKNAQIGRVQVGGAFDPLTPPMLAQGADQISGGMPQGGM